MADVVAEIGVQPFGSLLDDGARADVRLWRARNAVGNKDNHPSVGQAMHREIILPGAPL